MNISSFQFDYRRIIFCLVVVWALGAGVQASDQEKHLYCDDTKLVISYDHASIHATSFNEPPEDLLPLIHEDAGLIAIHDGLIYHQGQKAPLTTGSYQTLRGRNLLYWSGPQGVYSYVVDHQGRLKILPRFVMVKDQDPIKFTVYHTDMLAKNHELSLITMRVEHRLNIEGRKQALALRKKNRAQEVEEIEKRYNNPYVHSANRRYPNPDYKNWSGMRQEIDKFDAQTKAMQREIEELQQKQPSLVRSNRYVASAGDITIHNGKIIKISNQSGHLRTSPRQFALAVKLLVERNLLADDCQFEAFEESYETYVLDAGTSGPKDNPTYGKRLKVTTSHPTRQQLLAKAMAFLHQEEISTQMPSPLYGEKVSCQNVASELEKSSFDLDKARAQGFAWGLLQETQFRHVVERMVEFGDVEALIVALKALENPQSQARLFNQLDLLHQAIKHKSAPIFNYILSQSDEFLDAVVLPTIVQPINHHDTSLASKLVGLAEKMMAKDDQKAERIVSRILARVRAVPQHIPALEMLLSTMLTQNYSAHDVMKIVDSFAGLRLLLRLLEAMRSTGNIVELWQKYVEHNQSFKPFLELCALKQHVMYDRPIEQKRVDAYNLLAQDLIDILEQSVKLLTSRNQHADLFLGHLITLHGGSLKPYGNSLDGTAFEDYKNPLGSLTDGCLVSSYDAQRLGTTLVQHNDEKLSSYYLALDPQRNSTLILLGIYYRMQSLWSADEIVKNPPLVVPALHKGLKSLEENKQKRAQLFAAYRRLLDSKTDYVSDKSGAVIDGSSLLYPLGHDKRLRSIMKPQNPLHHYVDHLINVLLYKPHLIRSSDLSDPYTYPELIEHHLDTLVKDAEDYLEILEYALSKDPSFEQRYRYAWTDSYELYRQPRLVGQWDIAGYLQPPSFLDQRGEMILTINKKTVHEALVAYANKKDHPLLFALGVVFKRVKR